MPDAAATATAMNPGERVLVRNQPLMGRMTVDHVRTHFAGEPEPNGPVWCRSEDLPLGYRARYDQCELVRCPPDYEPPPPPAAHWPALRWLIRNRQRLTALHGAEAVALTERQIRERIILKERIAASLAADSGAAAMRQAEIALGEAAR